MTRRKFSREFKIEAVRLVTDRGVAVVTCHGLFPPSVTRVRPNERTDEDEEGTTDRGTDYRYPSGA